MNSIWFKNISFVDKISEEDAAKKGGVLAHMKPSGEIYHYEIHTSAGKISYVYISSWPAESIIKEHLTNHPGTRFRIRTPEEVINGYSVMRYYYINVDGILDSISEYANNLNETLCFERKLSPDETLLWTIESTYDESGTLLRVREIAPDGGIASETEY